MNLASQLVELAELRRDGALTEEEFIRAKHMVLGVDQSPTAEHGATTGDGSSSPGRVGHADPSGVVHDIRFRFDDGIGRTGS